MKVRILKMSGNISSGRHALGQWVVPSWLRQQPWREAEGEW